MDTPSAIPNCSSKLAGHSASNRFVEREILDHLDPADPRAIHSRGDLRKLNWIMGHAGALRDELATILPPREPVTLMELGCGDGALLCRALRPLPCPAPGSLLILVDAKPVLTKETLKAYARCGWETRVRTEDAVTALAQASEGALHCVVANLFLHHFEERELRDLLASIAAKSRAFVALEPRRGVLGRFASSLLMLIGCNQVTRHDAAISVRAGFCGNELSALWPGNAEWDIVEGKMGLFSHKFVARRKAA